MAHFAELDSNNVVLRVVVISNEDVDANGGDYSTEAETFVSGLVPHSDTGVAWKQTSYNGNSRKQYAGIDYTYDSTKDKFLHPQPFASWSLDANDDWQAPVAKPDPIEINSLRLFQYWDEDNQKWLGQTFTNDDPSVVTNYEWDPVALAWNEV
jgi:hypothetical protein